MNVQTVLQAVLRSGARKGTGFVSSDRIIRVSRRHKLDKRDKRQEFVLTIGKPNYLERNFIKLCKRAGEPIPVKRVQLNFRKWT